MNQEDHSVSRSLAQHVTHSKLSLIFNIITNMKDAEKHELKIIFWNAHEKL